MLSPHAERVLVCTNHVRITRNRCGQAAIARGRAASRGNGDDEKEQAAHTEGRILAGWVWTPTLCETKGRRAPRQVARCVAGGR
eukprot:3711410-Prymnesium_polylepis.1